MSVLGVDLGGTNVRAGLVEKNRLAKVVSSPINNLGAEKEVLNQIFSVVDPLIQKNLKGIGVGVPSVLDLKRGILYDVQNIPSWKRVPLKAYLEKRYQIPAYVNNDANCFAVGEKYFGRAKKYDQAVGLIVGTGLGAGIIANGRLYSGINCGAGEFGMIPYKDHNYEYYCCGQFFKNVHHISGKELYEKAKNQDADALQIFSEFGTHLGEAIKAILYATDPEIIILGGSVSKAFQFFRQAMWESVSQFAYSITLKRIKIEVSRVRNIAILGAAALYYDAQAK
jgi:glucokinase